MWNWKRNSRLSYLKLWYLVDHRFFFCIILIFKNIVWKSYLSWWLGTCIHFGILIHSAPKEVPCLPHLSPGPALRNTSGTTARGELVAGPPIGENLTMITPPGSIMPGLTDFIFKPHSNPEGGTLYVYSRFAGEETEARETNLSRGLSTKMWAQDMALWLLAQCSSCPPSCHLTVILITTWAAENNVRR